MRRSAYSDSRGSNAWNGGALSVYVSIFLVSISLNGPMPVAQEYEDPPGRA
jgi:hypothetical protein